MSDIGKLKEAFLNFTEASKSLEAYYGRLQEQVKYLTLEVEEKNRQLKDALSSTEEAKDYLKGILENLKDAIIVLDTDKNVSMMNRASEDLLMQNAEAVIGRPFEGLPFSLERDNDEGVLTVGSRKHSVIVSHSEVLDRQGLLRGHVILFKDITRIKELEAQNERNYRLIAMGEMAAKIVHEIRSPLCSIELYASMLARDLEGTQHMDMAKGISTGISSLNNILTNMLYFAKPQKPVLRKVDICRLLDETVFMLLPMIESRGLKFLREIEPGVSVRGDADLLKQVFLNILLNAIQVSSEGRMIKADCRNGEQSALIEISDEGPGIEPENIEKIFDPFFSTKEKGTGLGLAISAKIVQAHGGTIRVKSSPGHGAAFRLSFPENAGAAQGDIMMKEGIFL
ncbi:MAG: PAS domain-containing protein [Nitrospirae bacterium]|nr:PAS domain-containing protein [Nitrospirota bacterium]